MRTLTLLLLAACNPGGSDTGDDSGDTWKKRDEFAQKQQEEWERQQDR